MIYNLNNPDNRRMPSPLVRVPISPRRSAGSETVIITRRKAGSFNQKVQKSVEVYQD